MPSEMVQRADPASQQPRFNRKADWLTYNIIRMVQRANKPPKYGQNPQERDQWLRNFARTDPVLSSIINSVMQIDRNRGWSLTGGRNQVLRFANVFTQAEGGRGWRHFCGRAANDFYQTDTGTIVELGRYGVGGPLGAMWNVDSAKCSLTGRVDRPLRYRDQLWYEDDYFQVTPMPSVEEELNGLGFCAVSRALELSRIMVGILAHAQEKLASRAKKGFLSIFPISDEEWEKMKEDAQEQAEGEGRQYYGGVQVLRSEDNPIQVQLTALSQLPDGFNLNEWVQVLVSGYSLAFGYDVGEFWSPRSSGFSRGAEAEVQSAKATGKGEREFSMGMEERIQNELPESLDFEFDQRDDRAELVLAELHEKYAKITAMLFNTGLTDEERILTRDEVRSYLAEKAVISKEITDVIEESAVTDTKGLRERPSVHRAAEYFPREPLVRYDWNPTTGARMRVLFNEAQEAVRRVTFPAAAVKRATVFSKYGVKITTGDIDEAIEEAAEVSTDLAELLQATV